MSAKSAALRIEVLSLPAEDRAVLAAELLASLDDNAGDDDPAEVERTWGEEMARRSRQIASGEVKTVTWAEVLEQVAASRTAR